MVGTDSSNRYLIKLVGRIILVNGNYIYWIIGISLFHRIDDIKQSSDW